MVPADWLLLLQASFAFFFVSLTVYGVTIGGSDGDEESVVVQVQV